MYLSIHTVVGLEQQPLSSSNETEPVPKVDVEIEPKEQIVSIIEATYDENNSILSKSYMKNAVNYSFFIYRRIGYCN